MRCTALAIIAALSSLTMNVSASDLDPNDGHIHHQHPTTPHDGDFERVWMNANWTSPITENVNGPVEETLFFQMFSNCTPEPVQITIQETRTREHTYTVGASFEIGTMAEVSARLLVARGKAQAHSQVTFTGEVSATVTVQYQITESTPNPPCNRKSYLQTIERYNFAGSMGYADHDGGCWSWCCETYHTWQCNGGTQTADVVGFDGRHSQWNPEGECGNCDPDPCEELRKLLNDMVWNHGLPHDVAIGIEDRCEIVVTY